MARVYISRTILVLAQGIAIILENEMVEGKTRNSH